MTRLHLLLSAVVLTLAAPPASAQTWVGTAGDNNWNNGNNWLPAVYPNSPFNTAFFNATGAGPVNISTSVQAGSLYFYNLGANSFSLTSSAGQTLSGLTTINLLNPTGNDTGTQTINFAQQAGGNLLFANGGPLTITNNIGTNAPGLVIGPNTAIGTPGSGGVVFAGLGYTVLSGSFASGIDDVVGGLTKTGPGGLDFSGGGTNLTGGLTLNGGTLTLDYSTNSASKLGAGGLTLAGGVLALTPPASGTVPQAFTTGTFVNAGHTDILASPSFASSRFVQLNLGAITRSPGATIDIGGGNTFVAIASTYNTNNLLGTGPAYATYGGGASWAENYQNEGSVIAALDGSQYGADTYTAGTNTDVTVSATQSNITTNSLRFNTGNLTLALTGTNTLQSGGILVTPSATGGTITGGSLNATGNGELIIHQYSSGTFTIDSALVSAAGLTKTGPGTLVLGGFNNQLGGPINVNRGGLTLTNEFGVFGASAINFNDDRTSNGFGGLQQFTVDIGNSTSFGTGAPIQLSANSATDYGTYFSTGNSTGATVTLRCVLSSASGLTTPIRFTGPNADTSGFNLTNINTFTGNVSLYHGFLGINADASLGNAANTLVLEVFDAVNGGLVFLNSGINVAHPISLTYTTRIVSNGTDSNTISGPIFSMSSLATIIKAGTGTLTLANPNGNSFSGGVTVSAGTLATGVAGDLGTGLLTLDSGTFSYSGSTATTTNPIAITLNGGTIQVGSAATTLTANGAIAGPGGLTTSGAGTLILGNASNTFTSLTITAGTVATANDNTLGAGNTISVAGAGTLQYTGTTSTARTFNLVYGTLAVSNGAILTLNGASVIGGFVVGPGAYAVTGGASLSGVTTYASTTILATGAGSFTDFSSGGLLVISGGAAAPVTLTRFTNEGSGLIALTATSVANVADFQTYGTLTLNPAVVGSNAFTEMVNNGTTPLYFNGGSLTFIGTAATATMNGQPTFVAGIDLHGQNAEVKGGLFVNNGFVVDSTNNGMGTATVIADFGSLVKGAGFYQNTVITQNGGKFQAGNSPGSASFGNFVLGPGGVSNYVFAIDDATGAAGPSPDALGHVSGWGLVKAVQQTVGSVTSSGNFTWTATSADPLVVALDTLVNPTTVGTDVAGPMADFDPTKAYSWLAAQWTGTYSGPTDFATLNADTAFDTSRFVNQFNGTFGWSLDAADQTLSLTYTPIPVPEPGTLALVGLAAAGVVGWRRWGQPTPRPHPELA